VDIFFGAPGQPVPIFSGGLPFQVFHHGETDKKSNFARQNRTAVGASPDFREAFPGNSSRHFGNLWCGFAVSIIVCSHSLIFELCLPMKKRGMIITSQTTALPVLLLEKTPISNKAHWLKTRTFAAWPIRVLSILL